MAKILELEPLPTAVLASNDLTAIGVMRAVYAAGLRVPEDVSVVGFDDIALSSFMSPPLTTIRLPRADIAEFAFASLYAASQRGVNQGVTHVVRAELIIREVLAKLPDHPGAHHYRIHNWDYNQPEQALVSAKPSDVARKSET